MDNDEQPIETDLAVFVSELKTPWKTMDHDMDTAFAIITQHARTELELELLTVSADGGEINIDFPHWQTEMETTFVKQYGPEKGRLIFNKVMMRLYLMSRGATQTLH